MDEATNVIDRPSSPGPGSGHVGGAGRVRSEPAWRLSYNPALDGIRGVAVGVVLLFHAGYPWARGGYLGVSTFFTLSGFLITSLLLGERSAKGRIALGTFWARRMRRLLPASALTLVAVASLSRVFADLRTESLSGDIVASALQVANWRFLFDEQSYAELFASPSPVLHFWSLAIEEQFYWVFPLLTAGVLAAARSSVKAYAAVLAALAAVSAVTTGLLGPADSTAVYYATFTRMGEILVGSLLAVAVSAGATRPRPARRLAAAGGMVALAAMGWCWWNLEQATRVISQGGLLAYAVLSGALVFAACVPGPVRRGLAVEPLRLLGLISYGVYLVHWPIFLILDEQRTGLGRTPLFALRVAVTLAVAVASYFLLEKPIRRGWSLPRVPMPVLAAVATAAVVLVGVVVPAAPRPEVDDRLADLEDDTRFLDATRVPGEAVVGLGFGDSTMLQTARGLTAWGNETGRYVMPYSAVTPVLGCSVARGGERRSRGVVSPGPPEGCDDWAERIGPEVQRVRRQYGHLDFVLIQTGPWEVIDRRLPGSTEWQAPGDPAFDAYLERELAAATDLFIQQGLVAVWVLSPRIDVGRNQEPPPPEPYPESDPARMDVLNDVIRRVADQRRGAVTVDLPGYLRRLPGGEMDPGRRPDGVHFDVAAAYEIARDWLGKAVIDAVASEPNPLAPPRTAPVPGVVVPPLEGEPGG